MTNDQQPWLLMWNFVGIVDAPQATRNRKTAVSFEKEFYAAACRRS
jgi:hypothetical protein